MEAARARGVAEALGLDRGPELVAIVGGGGKSSLMFALGRELPGRVVMTTTTRIFAAQMGLAAEVRALTDADWPQRLAASAASFLLVGGVEGERAVGVPPELPAELLGRPDVDWVVVEAAGSRLRPLKAPGEHEPVVPDGTGLLVVVAGVDALAGPVREVAHRPERVSAITGVAPEAALTPRALARLLASPDGGLKSAPASARVAVMINKVESAAQRAVASRVARAVLREPVVERVVFGALEGGVGRAWEVRRSSSRSR